MWWNDTDRGESIYLEKDLYQCQFCPPKISHGLVRDWTQVSAVRSRRLTAWAMVQKAREYSSVPCSLMSERILQSWQVPQVSSVSLSDKSSVKVETCWNNTDREKPNYSKRNLFHCHIVHHKPHVDWPRMEFGPAWWETDYWSPEACHGYWS
jgi:hypothetical protein